LDDFSRGTTRLYAVDPVVTPEDGVDRSGIPKPIDLGAFRFPDSGEVAYKAANEDASGMKRNRLKALLVDRSNRICDITESQIAGTNDWINFGLGETTTILGGVGALVTAATPARVFSGSAGIVNATRSQVNEIFYQNAVKAAIIQKIDNLREAKLKEIDGKNTSTLQAYTVDDMIGDVKNYHNTCSFYVGIINLTRSSDKVTPGSAQDIINEIKKVIPAKAGGNGGGGAGEVGAGGRAGGGEGPAPAGNPTSLVTPQ
jgi:hypothetical protein